MKIKKHKQRVEAILRSNPASRDNNNILLAIIWTDECIAKGLNFKYILAHLLQGKLSPPEAIFRASRKLQETNPELRGKKRNQRMLKQIEVIEEIVTFDE